MHKVILFGSLPAIAAERLAKHHETIETADEATLHEKLPAAQGLLCLLTLQVDDRLLDLAPGLRVVSNFGVGYDNIDVAACSKRGIAVTNTPDVLTEATADLTWALLLAAARRIPEGDRIVRDGQWKGFSAEFMLGSDVGGKTMGIVGLGRIGRAVARRAEGFGMPVLYSHPRPVTNVAYRHVSLADLLRQSDVVSLHCPLRPDTHHMISSKELGLMKPDAIFVNTARGKLVDEAALIRWVESGHRAALDVFEQEPDVSPALRTNPHVVLAPHIGSATRETRERMANLAVDNIDAALSGKRPPSLLNPEVWDRSNP